MYLFLKVTTSNKMGKYYCKKIFFCDNVGKHIAVDITYYEKKENILFPIFLMSQLYYLF